MAKNKKTTKKSTTKKTTAKKTTAKKAVVTEEEFTEASVLKNLNTYSGNWKEWKDLGGWEKKSKVPKEEWKKRIMDRAIETAKKIFLKTPTYFEVTDSKSEEFYHGFLKEIKRRIYQGKYVKIAKPTGTSKTEKFMFYVIHFSGYNDWGNRRYEADIQTYAAESEAKQQEIEQKGFMKIKRDTTTGKMIRAIPMMNWGKKKIKVPIHAYMGKILAVGMPEESYNKAIEEDTLNKREDSEFWDELMPCIIDVGSDNQRDIHFGDPQSDKYFDIKSDKCYTANLYSKRGSKITDGEKTYYLYEGEVTREEVKVEVTTVNEKEEKTVDEEETKILTTYSGQRSFQYDLGPSVTHELKEIPISEFLVSGFDDIGSIKYFEEEVAYLSYSDQLFTNPEKKGMINIPDFFNNNHTTSKKGRSDAIHPIAFKCDVLSRFKSEPTEEQKTDPKWRPFRRLRLDDQLDGKGAKDGETEFEEITVQCQNLSKEMNESFENIAEGSKLKAIISLHRSTPEDNISGSCLWFDITKSTAVGAAVFEGEDLFAMEEDDAETSILDETDEVKSEDIYN